MRKNKFSRTKTVTILLSGLITSIVSSCRNPAKLSAELTDQVIVDAAVLPYAELQQQERDLIGEYCCSYSNGSWIPRELVRFPPEDAFFVKVRINIEALAQLTEANRCGSLRHPARCAEEELQAKAELLIEDQNPFALYGKYKNSWGFFPRKNLSQPQKNLATTEY